MLNTFLRLVRAPDDIVGAIDVADQSAAETRGPIAYAHLGADTRWPSVREGGELLGKVRRRLAGDRLAATAEEMDRCVEVLQLERYVDNAVHKSDSRSKDIIRQAYYLVRPALPVSVRKHLQRIALRDWRSIPFPGWPVDFTAEEITELIWKLVLEYSGAEEIPFIWFWPDGKSSGCIMTHDVETKAGRDFCRTLMEVEHRYSITSAFEVVPEERYAVPEQFLQDIVDAGCEVCVHGLNHDGRLFSSHSLFFERAKKINSYGKQWGAVGFRSPVLYRNLEWLHALSFAYDMSVPNVGHLDPQKGGCCTVMPYFIGNFVELPLTTVQDYSLYHILRQRSIDVWRHQIQRIAARHGLITFIIHPDYTLDKWAQDLYDQLLEHLAELRSEKGLWFALPREVAAWWSDRNRMEIFKVNGQWRIRGRQAERARIAYAALDGDRVVYRFDSARTVDAADFA